MSKTKIQKDDKLFFKKLEENSSVFEFNKIKKEEVDANTKKDFIDKNLLSQKDLEAIPRADFIPDNVSTVPMQTLKIVVFLACIFLIAIINLMFYQNYKKDKTKVDNDLADINSKISLLNVEYRQKVKELGGSTDVNEKINIINTLSKDHIYWTRCLNIIENATLESSKVGSISVDASGVINISMSSSSYKDMALQTQEYKKIKNVKEVKMSGASSNGNGVSYNITMNIEKAFYLKQ